MLRRVRDQADEPALRFGNHLLGGGPAGLVEGLERRRVGLQRAALDLVDLDAELLEQLANFGPLEDHADRAGDGVAARNDLVGGEPGDVGGRRGNGAELRHHRLGLGDARGAPRTAPRRRPWCRRGC